MKEIFTNNITAKLVALLLASLLWAVIKRSQVSELTISPPKPGKVEFGARAYGQ